MGKNKDKAKKAEKKAMKEALALAEAQVKAEEAAAEFPAEATPAADEKAEEAAPVALDTDKVTKKERKAIEALDLGTVHDFPRGIDQLVRVKYLNDIVADPEAKKKAKAKAEAELQGYRDRGTALMYERNREERKEKAAAKEGTKKKAADPAPIIETDAEVDDEVAAIKARVEAKREARYKAMIEEGASEESARQMSRFQAIRDEDPKGLTLGETGRRIMAADISNHTDEDYAGALDQVEPEEADQAPKKAKGKSKAKAAPSEPETAAQVAEEVQTETGREFAVGAPAAEADDLDPDPYEANRDAEGVRWSNHASPRPYIFQPDGKEALYSRMTSYIDVLDEKGGLQDWKDRMLLVGIARAAAELDPDLAAIDIVGTVNRLTDRTESAIKKADKALAKGKMTVDEHTTAVEEAEKAYKGEARRLAEDMRDRGGAHDKAQKGTDLHKVFEDFDNAKMEDKALTVDRWIEPGQPGEHLSKADVRDLRAYRAAVEAAGIEFLACEQRVVLDEYKVTGTLDRSIMATPPGASRRVRMVGDVKTGRMDLGVGKFATQVYGYAMGEGYANSTERVDLKHSRKWGVIFHSPAGQGRTTVWFMDLSKGAEGWKHIEAVRDWRRTTTEAQTFRGKSPYMFEGVSATAHEDGSTEVATPDAA